MTLLQFLRSAPDEEIAVLIHDMLSACECGVFACPLCRIAGISDQYDEFCWYCNIDNIVSILNSECSEKYLNGIHSFMKEVKEYDQI